VGGGGGSCDGGVWALITPGSRHLFEGEVSTAQTLRTEIIWVVTVSTRAGSLGQGNRWLEELHCETLHELCSSPNFIREMGRASGTYGRLGEVHKGFCWGDLRV
jgi:hypothetical protein